MRCGLASVASTCTSSSPVGTAAPNDDLHLQGKVSRYGGVRPSDHRVDPDATAMKRIPPFRPRSCETGRTAKGWPVRHDAATPGRTATDPEAFEAFYRRHVAIPASACPSSWRSRDERRGQAAGR